MTEKSGTYAIITPVRNEREYFPKLLESVVAQTVLPARWIIVNDGSGDGTEDILRQCEEAYPWIEVIHLPDRGNREPGGDSVFAIGWRRMADLEVEFLARIDADVSFAVDYFEKMIEVFQKNPRLGIASGEMVYLDGPRPEPVFGPSFQTHGPNKFYRLACLREIGGLDDRMGWDIVDNIRAIEKGWEARRIPELRFYHYRRVGAARGPLGIFENWGKAAYLTGYHPLFVAAKFARHLLTPPFVLGSFWMLKCYLRGFITGEPKIVAKSTEKFIKREQLKKLIGRKSVWS